MGSKEKSGTDEDKRAEERLASIVEKFPHRDNFEKKDFSVEKFNAKTMCVKSIEYLEDKQKNEPHYFWIDMCKANHLTMLYYSSNKLKHQNLGKAMKLNKEVLERQPRNFNALWNKYKINMIQKRYSQVREALAAMEEVLKDPIEMLTAQAEIGVNYVDLGPACYQKSTQLLEKVIKDLQELTLSNGLLRSQTIKWKFDLARCYNRLLNKGNVHTYWKTSVEPFPGPGKVFKRIKELLEAVISSGDVLYAPCAWCELADAYKKYEEGVPPVNRDERLPNRMTVDDCFEKAYELGPREIFVLERIGRHRRQRATCIEEFQDAIKCLEECVELDDLRDVAFHHMGLAYRSMWVEAERHEEERLHTNKAKRWGQKRSIDKKRQQEYRQNYQRSDCSNWRGGGTTYNPVQSSSSEFRGDRTSGIKSPRSSGSEFKGDGTSGIKSPRSSGSEFKGDGTSGIKSPRSSGASQDRKYDKTPIYGRSESDPVDGFASGSASEGASLRPTRSMPPTPIEFHGTIPPKYPKRPNEVPRHHRKPDYFDTLRVGNPMAKDLNHEFLQKARECFQKANDIRQGTSVRYLIDLARTYICTGELDDAWGFLAEARRVPLNSNDGAYLYEQWGLLEERILKERVTDIDADIESVKNSYRTAMRCSAECREKSRVAFYYLRDILSEQLKSEPSSEVLNEEYLLLYTTIEDSNKAQKIYESMRTDENIGLMWKLVELFHTRNRPEDADAAFTYLALLAEAKRLKEPGEPEKEIKEKLERVIEIGERRARKDGKVQEVLSKTFEWLVSLSDEEMGKDALKVCILAPSSSSPGVERVEEVLEKAMNIEVLRGYPDSDDILPGEVTSESIIEMAKRVKNAVVVMQRSEDQPGEDESTMMFILGALLSNHPPKRICRAASKKSTQISVDLLGNAREWKLDASDGNDADDQLNLAVGFLKCLFSPKKSPHETDCLQKTREC